MQVRVGAWVVTLAVGTSFLAGCDLDDLPPDAWSGPVPVPCASGSAPISAPGMPGVTSQWASEPVSMQDNAPPPISGGTLRLSADRKTLIAADPDRDAVYLVDVATRTLKRRIALQPRDEPGRVIQDRDGQVHVALRGGRSIASFDLNSDDPPRRASVCDLPRGLAYDPKSDRLLVACNEGVLVQVDPATGRAERKIELGRDLRDVVVRDDGMYVSRFRSAELLTLDADDGQVMDLRTPPTTTHHELAPVDEIQAAPSSSCDRVGSIQERLVESTPNVAWRTIDAGPRGVIMLHQRASRGEVRVQPGGYGGGGACAGLVRGAVTVQSPGKRASVDLAVPGVFVDAAYEPSRDVVAVANPAGWKSGSSVMVFDVPELMPEANTRANTPGSGVECRSPEDAITTDGQVTAVTFVEPFLLAVQEREPAGIMFIALDGTSQRPTYVKLDEVSRHDSGHALFHTLAGAGISCVSCHAEAGDDAHVWTFEDIGPRRTQTLRGGILGTEPFHWDGDMSDFSMLMNEVFTGRMGGFAARPEQSNALATWIDRQPTLTVTVPDQEAVDRGRELFLSEAVGCATCHSGPHFTNNQSADVGTGDLLQVPTLQGVSFRAPFIHNGCAPTLLDRFTACGGGDRHGKTSHLRPVQLADLTAYLETL